MVNSDFERLLDEASTSDDPRQALLDLARSQANGGVAQVDLYCKFRVRFLRAPADSPLYDVIADVMDAIVSGGWGGTSDLFPVGLSAEEIDAAVLRTQLSSEKAT